MENKEEKIVTKENGKKSKIKSILSGILTAIKKCPKIIKRGILVVILIAIVALGINYSYVFNKEAETLSIEFKNVGQLVTQSVFIRVLEDSTVNRTIFEKFEIPFTESRKMFSYIVQVDAGINFEEVYIEDINESTKTIKIKLPHSTISYIDSESWFSRIDSEKYNEALKDLTNQGKQDAIDNGILEKADENAKSIIESFIKSNKKYKDYKIEYEYIGGNKDE